MTATLPIPGTEQAEPFKAGVYDGMPDDTYHADPVPGGSLSASGARKLLPPSCPALFKHEQEHGRPPKQAFDFGHAAHRVVLGTGPELVVIDLEDWKTKAAREERDSAYADGAVPLLPGEYQQVQAMAAALREHPVAKALFDPDDGMPEQSLFWRDERTGVWRRSRLDWLRNRGNRRLILADYKTTRSAAPDDLQKAIDSYGYHQQAAFYLDGAKALGLAGDDAAFVFVFQMKTAPYLVTVVQLDALALQVGRWLNRQAIDLYAQCKATGRWPGFSDDVEVLPLPAWVERRYANEDIW